MKKQWISVKRGLSRDPKHRQAMGEGVWLYLHILDITSWDDGIAHDWKDEAAAEDMGMPVRTLREHRRRLAELGYITCIQKQYTQDIIVRNWTNPREYGGKVYNQGGSKASPQSDTQDYIQDYIQGYTQGSTQDVTPTYSSNIKESNIKESEKDIVDGILETSQKAQGVRDACLLFEHTFGFGPLPWDSKPIWRKFAEWVYATHSADNSALKDYVAWRYGKGQYKGAMTNTAIRRDPQIFMDTGWPSYLAYSAMYPNGENGPKPRNDIDALRAMDLD